MSHGYRPGDLFVVCGRSDAGQQRSRMRRRGAVLSVSSFFLLAAALSTLGSASFFTALLLSTSMGASNATYTRRGEVSVGLTYMTGALVKMGQHLAASLVGGPTWAWLPYGALWIMITIGSFVGALVYLRLGLMGLWIVVAALLVWTAVTFVRDSPERIFRAS